MSSETASIAAVIRTAGHITDLDVLALRRAIWGSNRPVGRDMAVLLLALNREIKDRAPTWPALYLDALTDFFLDGQAEPMIDGQAGELLIREITADGRVEDATELRLLLTLVARALRCPAAIVHLARERLLTSVQASDAPLFGKGVRRRSALDEDDVEAIRRLIYGQGGTSGLRVDEAEALWLATLDRATAQAQNAAAWPETFIKAMAMYLLLTRDTGERLDAAGVAWIRDHLDGGKGLTPNGRALVAYLQREAVTFDPSLTALAA
jgi:hypothetical protein